MEQGEEGVSTVLNKGVDTWRMKSGGGPHDVVDVGVLEKDVEDVRGVKILIIRDKNDVDGGVGGKTMTTMRKGRRRNISLTTTTQERKVGLVPLIHFLKTNIGRWDEEGGGMNGDEDVPH